MSRFILVRHGETEWNRRGLFQGHQDSPLTETGLDQAEKVGKRLNRRSIDLFVSSDLGRARQTSETINQSLGIPAITWDARLRERNYGNFEGLPHSELKQRFPKDYARFRKNDPEWKPEGGESHNELVDRVATALKDAYQTCPDGTILVVLHGGVLHAVMTLWAGLKRSATPFSLLNTSIAEFSYQGRRWRLETWGDTAHLEEASLDDD